MRRCGLQVVPWDYDFTVEQYDGLFLSNGPGDPARCEATIAHIRKALHAKDPKPIFGICLGNQLLALAAGAKTYKMKFGTVFLSLSACCFDGAHQFCLIDAVVQVIAATISRALTFARLCVTSRPKTTVLRWTTSHFPRIGSRCL